MIIRNGKMVTPVKTTYCVCGHANYEHTGNQCIVHDYTQHAICECPKFRREA